MSSGVGSELFEPLFGDPEVGVHLSDRARLQAMLDVEVALADAEAELGIIPPRAVTAIREASQAELFDIAAIAAAAADDGNLAIPLVRQLTRTVEERDRDAARYVHWGATSQDIIDTGLVLQLQRAVPPVLKQLGRAAAAATTHARQRINTAMAGRTYYRPAGRGFEKEIKRRLDGWAELKKRRRTSE